MGAFCKHCAERVKSCDAAHPLSRPFLRYCPKCGGPAEFTGEGFIIGGIVIGLFLNMFLCDELPIEGDIIGGALVALGLTRLCEHWMIGRKRRHVG